MSLPLLQNFINGRFIPATTDATFDVVDPRTEHVVAQCPVSGSADVDAAYDAALKAFESWRLTTPAERQMLLLRLADALEAATARLLEENRSPARRLGQIDNRGSHAWLALYWARGLAGQDADAGLAGRLAPVAEALGAANEAIQAELVAVQGHPVDIGGYYVPDAERTDAVMRPSTALNRIIDAL